MAIKTCRNTKSHAFRHVALPHVGLLGVIAEITALEHAANDLAQDEDADNRPVGKPANEEALDVWLPAAIHPPDEGRRVSWWQNPAAMDVATEPVRRNQLQAVAARRFAQVHTRTDLEGALRIRAGHAGPTSREPG